MRARIAVIALACVSCGSAARVSPTPAPLGSAPQVVAASQPVHWTLPTCPLRYEILTTETFAPTHGQPSELVTFMTVDATTSGGELDLHVTPTLALKNGKYRPYTEPDTGFPSLRLTTDGRVWRVASDSLLFVGLGSQGGLAWLLPELPDATHPAWDYPVAAWTLNANGVSAANSRAALPSDRKTLLWPLRQTRTTSPDGRLVVVARGPEEWSSRTSDQDFAVLERKGEIRTEHVILPSGRLLRAHLERDVSVTFTVQPREDAMRARLTQRSDAHLVSACDGPTEGKLEPVLGREERAIDAVGALGVALYTDGRHDAAIDSFSSALRAAKGDKAILAVIERYRKIGGDRSWPLPLWVKDDDVKQSGGSVEFSTDAAVRSPHAANTSTPVKFKFEMVETGGRFFVDRVTAAFVIEPGNAQVLEISKTRLFPLP